jgi:hypothetical protein
MVHAWFDGLSLTALHDGTTVISGPVVDQAALHGLLHNLRDVGIPLVSLALLPPAATSTRSAAAELLHRIIQRVGTRVLGVEQVAPHRGGPARSSRSARA